jgi:hypothetical protein
VLPSLERVTPRVSFGVVADPSARTAVEVKVVARGVDDLEALCSDGGDVGGGDPYPVYVGERKC